jgi:hypothetical protein
MGLIICSWFGSQINQKTLCVARLSKAQNLYYFCELLDMDFFLLLFQARRKMIPDTENGVIYFVPPNILKTMLISFLARWNPIQER